MSSRLSHAEEWRELRDSGVDIISTWIDKAGPGEIENFADLWIKIEAEIQSASCLIFYTRNEDFPFKGALVEVGMALSHRTPVFVVLNDVEPAGETMRPLGSWILDHRVTIVRNLEDALWAAKDLEVQNGSL